MLIKLKDHFIRQRVMYVGVGDLVVLHMWWKVIQDYGPGERGMDYPHKRMIPILSGWAKTKLSGTDKDNSSKET